MSTSEEFSDSEASADDDDDIVISDEEEQEQEDGGAGNDDGNDDNDDHDDDDDNDDDDDDDDVNDYDEDDCDAGAPGADDLSEFFESTLISTNEKEKQTKTQFTTFKEALDKKGRRTLPILSKYEKAKIIGVRAQQIAMGSRIYLPNEIVGNFSTPIEIAQEELRQKRTPLLVRRILDSKKCATYEDWFIADLIDPFEHL